MRSRFPPFPVSLGFAVELQAISRYNTSAMEEREFFDESESLKPANLSCLFCHQTDAYQIRWLVRTKKKALRASADERDRARFAKARSYMLRRDDFVMCKNLRCRKRFEISGVQSVVFL